jgi:hypothetical protein
MAGQNHDRAKIVGKALSLYMSQATALVAGGQLDVCRFCIIDPMSPLIGYVECGFQVSNVQFVNGTLLTEHIQRRPLGKGDIITVRGGVVASTQWGVVVDKYISYYNKGLNVVVLPLLAHREGIYIYIPALMNRMDIKSPPAGIKALYDFAVFARSIARINVNRWEIPLGDAGDKLGKLFDASRSFWLIVPDLSLKDKDKKEIVSSVLDLQEEGGADEAGLDKLDLLEEELQKPQHDHPYDFGQILNDPILS